MNMNKKLFWKIPLGIFIGVFGIVLCYLVYVLATYSRIEDRVSLTPEGTAQRDTVKVGETYTAVSQNLGFGAYTADFTFFMDGGTQSRAESEQSVKDCIAAGVRTVKWFDPDFILFQEVDTDSTRSFHVNQKTILQQAFEGFQTVEAVNYHSAYLMYPILEPHGASNSSLLTVSNVKVNSGLRRSFPISTGLSKFLDLDRCYSISRMATDNGKELILYNVHSSAYGGSDEIRTAQMTMLFSDMKAEYEKGNYVVCGGDFNHDFTGTSTQDLNGGATVDFGWAQPFPAELLPDGISRCTNYETLAPSCRNCDVPYEKGNFVIIVDGFLISDNVQQVSVQNIVTDFAYSDHNPVVLQFTLKP